MLNNDKNEYIHQLEDIERHIANPNTSTEEFMAVVDRWRQLSVVFYQQAGIQGKLFDSWTHEDKIDAVTAVLDGVDLDRNSEKNLPAEENVESTWMELCEDTERMELCEDTER